MKLLIVSHTEHYETAHGVVGFAPTVREIDQLATLFDEVVHVATLQPVGAPRVAAAYQAQNVRLRLVPAAGGETFCTKLGLATVAPKYLRAILAELRTADAVHVRCPAFLSLIALICLCFRRRPRRRWLKYAGNWQPQGREPIAYRMQRWILRRGWAGGIVTVNGDWPRQPAHVRSFVNPCLTPHELEIAAAAAHDKTLTPPIRLLFVGRLEREKGAVLCVEIAELLRKRGHHVKLDLVGDGPSREECQCLIEAAGMQDRYRLHGWLDRSGLDVFYAAAHFTLLPSLSEGWPKVLSEGMAHGAIPIAAAVSAIPEQLLQMRCGSAVSSRQAEAYADALDSYLRDPTKWRREVAAATESAERFGYPAHLKAVASVLHVSPA